MFFIIEGTANSAVYEKLVKYSQGSMYTGNRSVIDTYMHVMTEIVYGIDNIRRNTHFGLPNVEKRSKNQSCRDLLNLLDGDK